MSTAARLFSANAADSPALCAYLQWSTLSSECIALEEPAAEPLQAFLHGEITLAADDGLLLAASGSFTCAESLLDNYRANPEAFPGQLAGQGALLVVDCSAGCIQLAVDRLGRTPLYYCLGDGAIVLSSSLAWLRARMPQVALSTQALYDYVYFHMIPAPLAAYSGAAKLQSGQKLVASAEAATLHRYWLPGFGSRPGPQPEPAGRELRELLQWSVADSLRDAGSTGAFLSGGLDSSTIAGLLAEASPGSDAYAIGFEAEGYDEMPYARITAGHFGLRLHEYYVTPADVVEKLPSIAASFPEPFGNSSALPAYFCARNAASDGIDTLLAGDGGDELFAGNERYAKQKEFRHYQHIPGWFRRGLLEPLARLLPRSIPPCGKISSYIRQAATPLPERLQYYSFLEQIAPGEVFTEGFLNSVDTGAPLDLIRDIYHAPAEGDELDRMLYLDWQVTLADNDLRKVSHACKLAGVAVRFPMLDDRLVEFSTRIPSDIKLPGRALRDYYKRAMQGWLPEATINKSKHGFGLPFGVWTREHAPLQAMAYEHILGLESRNIFKPEFLEDAIARHRSGHAAYYGELIWVLMVLEIWISANLDDYRYD